MNKAIIPLVLFSALVGLLYMGLGKDPRYIPSPFLNKPAPEFSVSKLYTPEQTISKADLMGKVWLMNAFASWCFSCRHEHPVLTALARRDVLPIVGLDWKDEAPDAKKWLAQHGNPYTVIAHDLNGDMGIDYGVTGVPETFLVDKKGIVRYKLAGPLTNEILRDELLPLVATLQKEG